MTNGGLPTHAAQRELNSNISSSKKVVILITDFDTNVITLKEGIINILIL